MKKYKVYSSAGSYKWDKLIESDYMEYGKSGVFYFHNSETGEEWWFPVMHTIVERFFN